MKKISVFIKNYSIGKSAPILNLLEFLIENFKVDLYIEEARNININLLKQSNVKVIDFTFRRSKNFIKKFLLKKKVNKYLKSVFYDFFIVVDPHAFAFCMEIFPHAKPFYYSLELYIKEKLFNLKYPKYVENLERSNINKINGLMIQSEERETIFRNEYKLCKNIPTFILPVCYKGNGDSSKNDYLRKKFNIDNKKKIALHLGGIQEYHRCIEIAKSFKDIKDWVLVFHGYFFGNYIEKLKEVIRSENIKNVLISNEVFDEITDINKVIQSADVGIAYYENMDLNFYSAGKSSGKISAYFRFGLPVISNNFPSFIDAIENTGSGVCISEFNEIKKALNIIVNEYEKFSTNSLQNYNLYYNFELYENDLLKFFNKENFSKVDF